MPVEIREIIIKTEITIGEKHNQRKLNDKDLLVFRRQLLEEIKAIMHKETTRKNIHKR
jgi:hypothetical protein